MRNPDTVDAVIQDWLAHAASATPDAPFLEERGETYTFSDIDERVGRLAGGLLARYPHEETFGLWANNDVASVAALFAIIRVGAACFLINTRLTPTEVKEQLNETGVSVVVSADQAQAQFGPQVRVLSADSGGDYVAGADHEDDAPCLVVYTSGSSGRARGVILSWANVDAAQRASAQHLGHRADDVWLCVLPIFHVGGAAILIRSAAQGSQVLLRAGFDVERTSDDLTASSIASVVPTQLQQILDHSGRSYSVRAVLVGGGPASQELLERAYARGMGVVSTYGMTEAGSQLATAVVGSEPERIVVPIPGAEMAIRDDGVVLVRGPMVSHRYVDGASRGTDEWLVTGDLAERRNEGYRILGRSRDIIITGGENVMASEVERALERADRVAEAAVVGVPDEYWGEVVAAAIVLADSDTEGSFEALADELRGSIAGYKVPKRWLIVDQLPRTSIGKIATAAVAEMFDSGGVKERD